jgi:hypothetical protein
MWTLALRYAFVRQSYTFVFFWLVGSSDFHELLHVARLHMQQESEVSA